MATGSNRRMITNTREKILSPAFNRPRAFPAAHLDEIARFLVAVGSYPGFVSPGAGQVVTGFTEDHSTTESPLYGQVIGGPLCRPIDGSMNIQIDPGVAMVVDPDASPSPDDSPYKLIRDPGGVVSLTSNGSGSVRIDVLECSRIDVVTQTDSRNQYDTSTGLFTPVSFDKVAQGQFQYRIRLGTPGAGIPSSAGGWMPLLVIRVPNGTSTILDACTFWDVRPLVSARYQSVTPKPEHGYGHFQRMRGTAVPSGSNIIMDAQASVCDQWGYKLGGNLQVPSAAGFILSHIDLTDAANQESGFSPSASAYYYVYLAVPFSASNYLLGPRWTRYGRAVDIDGFDVPGAALSPQEPTGFIVVSKTSPDESGVATLSAPAATGLGCSMRGYCIATGWMNSGGAMRGFVSDGNRTSFLSPAPLTTNDYPAIPSSVASNVATFNITPDSNFPRTAKALIGYVTITGVTSVVASHPYQPAITVATQSDANIATQILSAYYTTDSSSTPSSIQFDTVRIPLESPWFAGDMARVMTFQLGANIGWPGAKSYIRRV